MINMLSTIRGSLLEKIYPSGWDLAKIDACCSHVPETITQRQAHWHADFEPVACESLDDFAMLMGHEIALEIKRTRDEGRKLIMILPVGPMGMYRWVVFFLKSWQVSASHVYGFNMDEWSDADGNTVPGSDKASFQNAMQDAFYGVTVADKVDKRRQLVKCVLRGIRDHAKRVDDMIGLKRRGFTDETVSALKEAYRIVFRSSLLLADAVRKVEQEVADLPEVRQFLDFIRRSERGICR